MMIDSLSRTVNEILTKTIDSAMSMAPRVVGAIILAGAGWLVAWLLRKIALRTVHGLDQLLERKAAQKGLRYVHIRQPIEKFIGDLVFWLVLVFFLILAMQLLQLEILSSLLANVMNSLPMLAMGVVIIVAAFFLGTMSRQLVISIFAALEIEQAELLGNTTRWFVVSIGLVLGIAQTGVDISLLATVISVAFGAIFGGLALAFGMGAQTYVANILGAAQVRRVYQEGDTVVVDGVQGTIVEIEATLITLQTEEGQVVVPAKLFLEQQSRLLDQDNDHASR